MQRQRDREREGGGKGRGDPIVWHIKGETPVRLKSVNGKGGERYAGC